MKQKDIPTDAIGRDIIVKQIRLLEQVNEQLFAELDSSLLRDDIYRDIRMNSETIKELVSFLGPANMEKDGR